MTPARIPAWRSKRAAQARGGRWAPAGWVGLLGLIGSALGVFAQSPQFPPQSPPLQSLSSRSILVDGRYEDWEGLPPDYSDGGGDGGPSGVDFGRVWVTNDAGWLFLRFEAGADTLLQSYETLVLYLDTDHSASTGLRVNGIGADLSWRFGERRGYAHTGGDSISLGAYDLGIVAGPTVSSEQFELEIPRDAVVAGSGPVFPGPTLRWLLRDESAGSGLGDQAPDSGRTASFTFDETPVEPYVPIAPAKDRPDHLRVLTYNVQLNGLFERPEPFRRILRAIEPDILNFQEIYTHTYEETRAQVEQILPLPPGQQWYAAQRADTITVSRYPIRSFWSVDTNLAVLIDLPDGAYAGDLFILNAHLPAGSREEDRQAEADAIMGLVRDAHTPGGLLELEPGTPILIVGDLNLVGDARQLETLLTGDIVDEETYGPDHAPDWDGSALADFLPCHNGERQVYTWWSPESSFGPGRLDFLLYSDSVLVIRKAYALRTESMSALDLAEAALERDDCHAASDHLPVVADFVFAGGPFSAWRLY